MRGRVSIEAVAWDRPGAPVPMFATLTPQAVIERGLPRPGAYRKPDGSAYLSGTEWEYLDALAAHQRQGRPPAPPTHASEA